MYVNIYTVFNKESKKPDFYYCSKKSNTQNNKKNVKLIESIINNNKKVPIIPGSIIDPDSLKIIRSPTVYLNDKIESCLDTSNKYKFVDCTTVYYYNLGLNSDNGNKWNIGSVNSWDIGNICEYCDVTYRDYFMETVKETGNEEFLNNLDPTKIYTFQFVNPSIHLTEDTHQFYYWSNDDDAMLPDKYEEPESEQNEESELELELELELKQSESNNNSYFIYEPEQSRITSVISDERKNINNILYNRRRRFKSSSYFIAMIKWALFVIATPSINPAIVYEYVNKYGKHYMNTSQDTIDIFNNNSKSGNIRNNNILKFENRKLLLELICSNNKIGLTDQDVKFAKNIKQKNPNKSNKKFKYKQNRKSPIKKKTPERNTSGEQN